MLHSILPTAQDRSFKHEEAGPPGPDVARALADLALHGAAALAPTLKAAGAHPGLLATAEAHPLRVRLLKTAMEPLERGGDWQPMALLLRALNEHSAPLMQDILLPGLTQGAPFDPAMLPDATVVVLAGLIAAGDRPGRALALLDTLEGLGRTPRFMAMSWQARCHILGLSSRIDALWPGGGIDGTGLRARARRHAAERRMAEALADFAVALDQAATPAARRGLGGDLAVMAAWLHGHGQAALLVGHHDLACLLDKQPAPAREALDLLLRAPVSAAWEPMREDWLSDARDYFERFLPLSRIPMPRPDEFLMRCRPAA